MSRISRRQAPKEEEPALDMSSLIDVSFLLLIYFLVTSTLDPKEADLGIQLPTTESSASTAIEIDQMTIELNAEGHIIVDQEVLDTDPNDRKVPLLTAKITEYSQAAQLTNSQPVVIVKADDAAKGQRFVDVLDALAGAKISSVTLTGFTEE
ncbi:MAG: biopolymer transporter ExbD [Verrucomicrobiae bacterium]|nr:biopolymer transporter ExbD [Verrucomicrobiae bacterium]MCB1086994.1 biopolymer transporter ExbD [Verrucomicrobiae bacterium]MCB1090023.1 biopolymer transporter ExbD [Verrucomicrobiae bacterium]